MNFLIVIILNIILQQKEKNFAKIQISIKEDIQKYIHFRNYHRISSDIRLWKTKWRCI